MLSAERYSSDTEPSTHDLVTTRKPICAIQITFDQEGRGKLGMLSQLGSGTLVELCGEGFNDRTVKVHANGRYYFVFLQDIEEPKAFAATA